MINTIYLDSIRDLFEKISNNNVKMIACISPIHAIDTLCVANDLCNISTHNAKIVNQNSTYNFAEDYNPAKLTVYSIDNLNKINICNKHVDGIIVDTYSKETMKQIVSKFYPYLKSGDVPLYIIALRNYDVNRLKHHVKDMDISYNDPMSALKMQLSWIDESHEYSDWRWYKYRDEICKILQLVRKYKHNIVMEKNFHMGEDDFLFIDIVTDIMSHIVNLPKVFHPKMLAQYQQNPENVTRKIMSTLLKSIGIHYKFSYSHMSNGIRYYKIEKSDSSK